MSIQKINVKNTYVATVNSNIANRALSFYVDNNKKDIVVEDSVFPKVEPINNSSIENNDASFNQVANLSEENNTEPVENNMTMEQNDMENTVKMPLGNEVDLSNNNVVNSAPMGVEIKPEIISDLAASNLINNVSESVVPEPIPTVPAGSVIQPIPNPESIPVVPTPVNEVPINVNQQVPEISNNNVLNANPIRFDASHETNLLGALEEKSGKNNIGNINVTADNLNVVREFGVDEPILADSVGNPVADSSSGGFVNSKILLVIVIILFLASCVFLGYEIYKYVTLPK